MRGNWPEPTKGCLRPCGRGSTLTLTPRSRPPPQRTLASTAPRRAAPPPPSSESERHGLSWRARGADPPPSIRADSDWGCAPSRRPEGWTLLHDSRNHPRRPARPLRVREAWAVRRRSLVSHPHSAGKKERVGGGGGRPTDEGKGARLWPGDAGRNRVCASVRARARGSRKGGYEG